MDTKKLHEFRKYMMERPKRPILINRHLENELQKNKNFGRCEYCKDFEIDEHGMYYCKAGIAFTEIIIQRYVQDPLIAELCDFWKEDTVNLENEADRRQAR